ALIFKKIEDWKNKDYISIIQYPIKSHRKEFLKIPVLSAKAIKELSDLQKKLFQSGFKIKKNKKR
ncbi:MAG: hypothetical protein ACFE96_17595, partial [Candidatus Hermodarchaeota archaeon]